MEKILKRILIPFLFVILTIKSAYAETIDLYSSNNSNIYFSDTMFNWATSYNLEYSFSAYDNIFNYNFATFNSNHLQPHYINSVLYYLPDSSQYLLLNFWTQNNISFENFDIDIVLKNDDNTKYCYEYYNSNNNKVQNCQSNTSGEYATYWGSMTFINTTYDRYWYRDNFGLDVSWISSQNNGTYYTISQSSINSPTALTSFINNQSKLQFVSVQRGNFYIQGQLIGSASGESPEDPEPEEPETPIFNSNLNKFYVPNYEKGQCVEVLDKDTLRVFDDENTDFYTDYYINSNYISKTGQVDLDYEKNCSQLEFTDIRYYGNDFPQILFILFCITIFTIGIPYILYKRFRKR